MIIQFQFSVLQKQKHKILHCIFRAAKWNPCPSKARASPGWRSVLSSHFPAAALLLPALPFTMFVKIIRELQRYKYINTKEAKHTKPTNESNVLSACEERAALKVGKRIMNVIVRPPLLPFWLRSFLLHFGHMYKGQMVEALIRSRLFYQPPNVYELNMIKR